MLLDEARLQNGVENFFFFFLLRKGRRGDRTGARNLDKATRVMDLEVMALLGLDAWLAG